MKKIRLGSTGPEVSAICLGSMTWGRQNTEQEGHAQLDYAIERGVNFVDTAEMYPVNPVKIDSIGRTESYIGHWLGKRGGRDKVVIATKVSGLGQIGTRNGAPITAEIIRSAVESSLKRLNTDYVDVFQLHVPNRNHYHFRKIWGFEPSIGKAEVLASMEECLTELATLQRQGKIRSFGLSNETSWGMAQWLRLAELGVGPRPVTIQNEYSLLCRYFDSDLAELAVNEDVTLLAYSPLSAGLLTGKHTPTFTPADSRRAINELLGGRITPRVWPAIDAYVALAREAGIHPATFAISFVLSRAFPAIPIVGARTVDQLSQTLNAASVSLTDEMQARIDEAYKQHPMPY
ncbi:NADP-dependent oxidoreductase [Pseudomonas amygdali pv. eriobotryae]|uniref:NADP-dependent oxidoreductase n=1 Tax=Pseudomonas amygdali pv. eriobotryae TaxID=129137 RepID=A0A0P9Q823_PSEA0|nr:aldo/keto reductase [Pseudomonas amygdali]KPX20652.1 NADP-dependent oxidoreductase [Pseudomonas amygdali pv. eriobotryae]KWS78387.1 aldo/keto reductase [Pseudomonas amygdali pv. eriobotryae]RMM02430.1 putative proteinP-dependent oxidoreductase [Pseudomonas amygdali pv. eriobotryae]RMO66784.1 putative proteinP-dependent oxidoreductase [Pseudomonas amygdali pv. eriobotryae]GFZ62748.1 NADP-dependent oxidoreductase [Pseudomonas amygdali pv. eriobotryae]